MESEELSALIEVYQGEAAETLDALAQAVEALRGTSPKARADLIRAGIRLAHNLKGASQSVGLTEVAHLAHGLEDSLGALEKQPVVEEEALAAMLRDVSVMQRLSEAAAADDSILRRRLGEPETDAEQPDRRHPSASGTVRVEAHRIDRLMGFTGELLIAQATQVDRAERLEQFARDLTARVAQAQSGDAVDWEALTRQLEEAQQSDRRQLMRFGNVTAELRDALKAVRMVRLGAVAAGWRRTVRETAQSLGKLVQLQVSVGEIEIDKQVLDRLHDPLFHVLRNAVDHGIESPEERTQRGKPALGTITISAEMQGAMARVEVSDDGRGVDVDRVIQVARDRQLTVAPTDTEVAPQVKALLFGDSFSTAPEVTEISGRGVGLGVVRRAVEDLGGQVDLAPHGRRGGACLALTVPLSVLSTRELLVRAGRTVCALPIESIDRALRLDRGSIERLEGAPVAQIEGADPLRVAWLSQVMGEEAVDGSGRLFVLVLRRGGERLGVVVDEVLQQGEFVIQRLPWNLKRVPNVSGAVILADGSLAAAIDVAQVFEHGSIRGPGPRSRVAGPSGPSVLVVDDSLTTRTLHRDLLAGAGYDVVVAANGAEAWDVLAERHVDLVVTDILMPEVDGWELTRRIRGNPRLAKLPVVLVTSLGTPDDMERGVRVGASAYVVKGQYDQDQLLKTVATHV